MYLIANILLLSAFCTCLGLAAFAFWRNVRSSERKTLPSTHISTRGQTTSAANLSKVTATSLQSLPNKLETASLLVAFGLLACCLILLQALLSADFNLEYAFKHINLTLPMFYRFSALWAGAEGSLLTWATATALLTVCFQFSGAYHQLVEKHKIYFWFFYFLLLSFLLFLLFNFSNPFISLPDHLKTHLNLEQNMGVGLSPTLQHTAMLFHPPLLLLGYAALGVPACLGLSRLALNSSDSKERAALRVFLLLAWALLTAGIVSGAWWANRESTWGNYWSWDPVESMSLLPWLACTAALHANILERKAKHWANLDSLLAILPLLTCWLGTYVVRSGMLSSRHNFNLDSASLFWLVFILLALLMIFLCQREGSSVSALNPDNLNPNNLNPDNLNPDSSTPEGPLPEVLGPNEPNAVPILTGSGLTFFGLWAVLAGAMGISLFLLCATFWPVISKLVNGKTFSLQTSFFSQTCLPLLMVLLLLACLQALAQLLGPRFKLGPSKALSSKAPASFFAAALFLSLTLLFGLATKFYATCTLRAAAALSALLAALAAFNFIATCLRQKRLQLPALSAFLAHAGLGLALTGAFLAQTNKFEWRFQLKQGETSKINETGLPPNQSYSATLLSLKLLPEKDMATLQAKVEIKDLKRPENTFVLNPERRLLLNQNNLLLEKKAFHSALPAEVSLALLGVMPDKKREGPEDKKGKGDKGGEAMFQMLIQPCLPLLWLGCILMCLCPLTLLFDYRKKKNHALP